MSDLLSLTAELVDIPSVSSDEKAIADYIESELRQIPGLQVERIGDNLDLVKVLEKTTTRPKEILS